MFTMSYDYQYRYPQAEMIENCKQTTGSRIQ